MFPFPDGGRTTGSDLVGWDRRCCRGVCDGLLYNQARYDPTHLVLHVGGAPSGNLTQCLTLCHLVRGGPPNNLAQYSLLDLFLLSRRVRGQAIAKAATSSTESVRNEGDGCKQDGIGNGLVSAAATSSAEIVGAVGEFVTGSTTSGLGTISSSLTPLSGTGSPTTWTNDCSASRSAFVAAIILSPFALHLRVRSRRSSR